MAEMLETTRAKQRRYPDEDIRQALFSRVHDMQLMPELIRLITNEKVFPKIVDIVDSLPHTPSGKVMKFKLREAPSHA